MSTQSSITELQFTKDAIITLPIYSALKRYEELNSVVDITRANLLLVEEELNLAQDDYQITEIQLDSNNTKKQLLASNLYILQIAKTSIESIFSNKEAVNKGKIKGIQDSLNEANAKLNTETNAANKDAIVKQINGYYIQIQEEQNLLSLIYADYQQDTEVVHFKINQINTDLQQLETQIIPGLKNVLEVKNQRLDRFNNERESLQEALADAEKGVQDFLQQNSYLESKDYSSQFIQDAINNVNQKVAIFQTKIDALNSDINASIPEKEATKKQLEEYNKYSDELQKYYDTVVQEESEFKKERTIIETTADKTNESVNLSLQTDSVQAYKDLSTQLITQLKDLVDIWVDNLRENYKLTIDIWESSQDYSTSFDLLTTYIEKTLAEPHEEYYLDELQLDEAIKIQESTVNRRDAFAESVDYVENSLDLYKKQDEEIEKLSNILQNFRELTDYESQYANLQKSYRELEQKKQTLETDYAQKQNIRQQKEQSLKDAQQAYNSKIDSATTTIVNANQIYFGGRGGGWFRNGINASDARTIAIGIANSTNQSAVKGVTDALRNELKQSYSLLSNSQQEKDTAVNNETSARQSLEAFLAEFPVTKNSLDNQFNELNPLFSNELLEDINQLPERYDLHSEYLKAYITQQTDVIDKHELASVQKLRIEIANSQYSQTQSIRQQKEQQIKDAQKAYNSKIDSATLIIIYASTVFGGGGRGLVVVKPGINASNARTIAIGIANSTNQSAVKGVTDALRNELKQSYSLLSNSQQEKDTAASNENIALQTLQNLQAEKIDNVSFDALISLLNNELQKSSSSELKAHIQQEIINLKQDKIASLQNLRLEVAYLDTVEEQNSEKLNTYLQKYQIIQASGNISWESKETQIDALRNEYFPGLNDAQVLSELQQGIIDAIRNSQQKIEELKASVTQKQAEAAAALSQADWYEEQANFHWDNSRKQGPTWSEQRTVKGKSGKSSTETIIHVDHDWIIWDTYTKEFTALRQYAENLLKGVETDTVKQDTFTTILEQWNKANDIADQAAITQDQLLQLLKQLEAERKLNTDRKAQISEWEILLPALKAQLEQAIKGAEDATAKVGTEWTEYEDSKEKYQTALDDVLKSRAKLQTEAQELQQEIATAQRWVTQQNTYLTDDITEVKALLEQLHTQRDSITKQLVTATVDSRIDLLTKQGLLDYSIQLLTQKQTILTAEQASFTQKQTLLYTQQQLIETEYKLFDAYVISPGDISNLENLLIDTRATLAEVQRLAQEAKASSEALTAVMEDLQITLKLQNDKYLAAIKDEQQTLQELIQETELKENYTAQAGTIQRELNSIDSQLLDALRLANDAGSQEAAKLLEVARNENIATAAELYYKDYRDLANDNGGSCSRGVARPEDLQLADYYYNQMLEYRRLQSLAEQQVNQFATARQAIEDHIQLLEGKKSAAFEELIKLNKQIADFQGNIEELQQELKIADFRVDTLSKFQEVTQKSLVQLLSVEQLNLAQAKLEQEIALNRENVIDEAVKNYLERERLDIERDRYIAIAKLEQLNQLKTEDVLQQAINNLRFDLGLNPIDDIIRFAEWKGQLAGILADIEALQQNQPSLPEATRILLNNTLQDIQNALEGEESLTIQDNLLRTANALIEQSNTLNREVATLQQEEQRYLDLLTQSETDLQSATKALYDEINKSVILDSEITAENLEILYKIGYAKGAIDESSDLAKQSRKILEQVIAGRIEQRKAREKAAFNEIFGTVTLVISAVAAVFTAGASLAANGTLFGVSASTISSIGTTLKTISSTLSIVQAAYNGDWSTVIFKVGLSFADGLKDIAGLSDDTVRTLKTSLNTAYAAYKEGDSIGALLGAVQGIGAIAADGIDLSDLSQVSNLKTFLITTSQISTVVHAGIQAIKNGDILEGIQALGKSLGIISKNFSLGLEETVKDQLEDLTGLEWQKLDKIIDLGGNAYNAIKNEDWIDLLKAIGGTVKIIDEDFALEIDNQGQTALRELTGLEWSEFEQIIDASQTLRVAIKTKNITDISASLNKLANVWVTDDELKSKLVTAFGLDWQDLTDIAKTGDILIPAIRNGNTEAWAKATGDFLNIWESNAAFQKHLKDTTNLEWTEFKQLVAIGQTVSLAVDQRSINAWVDALRTTLDWALKDTSFDNERVNQIISTAKQINNADSWVTAVDQLLGVAEDATALRDKLGGITGVNWDDFKQIINAGQAIATAIDDGNFTKWGDALKKTLNIWVNDEILQQQIETTTGLKWEQLTRIGSTYEAVRQADEGGDATSWFKAADQILTLWEKDTTFQDQVKTLSNLDWQQLKDLVAIGKTIDTAIDQKTYDAWRDALQQTVNFWVTDQTLNQSLESLIDLNWNQLDKIGQASDALYKVYDKADAIIDQALDSNNYQDWLSGIKDVYKLWKDDPILRQKVTNAGNVIWSEVEGILKAERTLDTKNRQDTIQTNIQNTISNIETSFQQKLESSIGLSWTQVKAIAQSGQIIAKAIADNKTEQWIKASNEILSIWEKDSELRQVLKDKYNIDWTNIQASVSSGQNLAKAIEANTVPAWGTALQNIINDWARTTTLTPQQQEKLKETNNRVNQVKASNNSQDWLAVTNQIIDLWKDETAFQIQLQQNNQLSWQDISNSVKSGQVLALEQNGLEQWLGNLKNVVEIWKSDPEIKTIVENVSDLNWQSLSNIINDNSLNFINGDNNNNNLVGTAKNDYIDAKDGNDYLDGGTGNDTLYPGTGADMLTGGTGNDKLYLGDKDGVVDIVNYAFGDGADTLYQFVRGVGGDKIQFTGITNIDVVTLGTNTLLRLGDSTIGNAGFGTGELLVRLSGTSGFSDTDVNVNLFGTNFLFS